jgi:hypothetical protein
MRTIVSRLVLYGSTLALFGHPLRAAAQTTQDDVLRELAALRAEVRQLREELDALKAREPSGEIFVRRRRAWSTPWRHF